MSCRKADADGMYKALKADYDVDFSLKPGSVNWVSKAEHDDLKAEALNPKDLVGAKKLPLELIPRGALIGVARAMAEGARKYGPFNWRDQSIQAVTYAAAALRHVNEWLDGEDIDPETGDAKVHHIDLAIAGLMIMRDAALCGTLRDNRHTPGNFGDGLRAATKP